MEDNYFILTRVQNITFIILDKPDTIPGRIANGAMRLVIAFTHLRGESVVLCCYSVVGVHPVAITEVNLF